MESTTVEEGQVVFEAFRDGEDGDFGITFTSVNDEFDVGPFTTFEEVQNAFHTLVDDLIRGQIKHGKRFGIRRILLCVVPDRD